MAKGQQATSSKGLLEFLEELRRERIEIEALILGIEKRLGIVSKQPHHETGEAVNTPRVSVSVEDIPVGFFHNLSQAAAAEKLLALNPGHPLSTQDMLVAFRKGGMTVNGKNAATILYTTLRRHPKFERVAGKAWGLAEWYPERRRRGDRDDSDGENPS